ncbi:MAG: hypothetical protein ACQGVC_07525 [Myxococcota bacterium]
MPHTAVEGSRQRTAPLLLAALLGVACGGDRFLQKEPRVRSIDDVGSIRASVVSVEEWGEYVQGLVPGFKLTGDQALAKVVPDTRLLDERRLTASRTEFQAGLPGLGAGANPGDRFVDTPPTTEGLDTSSSAAGTRTADGLGAVAPLTAANLDAVDPMTQYTAANALFQEVQLLNRAVRDAAQRDGYEPYVVRINVGLLTHRRNLPYDVYANLSFFTQEIVESISPGYLVEGELPLPHVLPLLVTDSLEATMHSASLGRLIEIGLALQGTTGTTALGLDQDFSREDLERALGRDLNSLFMVSRLSDNTVRVRLGANQQVATNYAVVPRNHTLTLLVLLPAEQAEPGCEVLIQARTEMLHVRSGRALPPKSKRRDREDVNRIAERFGLCDASVHVPTCRKGLVSSMDRAYFAAVENDWNAYASSVRPLMSDTTDMLQLWSELVNLAPGYYEDEVTFEVPDPGAGSFPTTQMATLVDDTKKTTVVRVHGGTRLRASRICSSLLFQDTSAGGSPTKAILPEQIDVDSRREIAVLTFRSLKALGLAKYASETGKSIHLQTAYAAGASDRAQCWTLATTPSAAGATRLATLYHATAPTPTPAGFGVVFQPSHVVSHDGMGALVIEFETPASNPAAKAVVEIANATVVSVQEDGGAAKAAKQKFEIAMPPKAKSKKRVTVNLRNLVVGKGLKVDLKNDKKVAQGTHAIEVRRP